MSGPGLRMKVRAWGRRQLYSLFSSLGALVGHPLGTTMTVLVLGISMALPLGLFVAVNNLHGLDLHRDSWGTISVFMEMGVDESAVVDMAGRLQQEFGAGVEMVSPGQGLAEFAESSGFGQVIDAFETNPLPWVLHVSPEVNRQDQDLQFASGEIAAWAEGQPGVEVVQLDQKWLQRLAGLLSLGDALVLVMAAMLSLAVVVVVANTIRLDVANRSGEIQVLNMVGAPDGFIRQPFLYSGLWYGIMGGCLALVLLAACLYYLELPLARLLHAYGSTFEARGLGVSGSLLVLLSGGTLGLLGAWVSVQRYLRQFRVAEATKKQRH